MGDIGHLLFVLATLSDVLDVPGFSDGRECHDETDLHERLLAGHSKCCR